MDAMDMFRADPERKPVSEIERILAALESDAITIKFEVDEPAFLAQTLGEFDTYASQSLIVVVRNKAHLRDYQADLTNKILALCGRVWPVSNKEREAACGLIETLLPLRKRDIAKADEDALWCVGRKLQDLLLERMDYWLQRACDKVRVKCYQPHGNRTLVRVFNMLREMCGCSIPHIAQVAGVNRSALNRWCDGTTSNPDDFAKTAVAGAFSKLLGCEITVEDFHNESLTKDDILARQSIAWSVKPKSSAARNTS